MLIVALPKAPHSIATVTCVDPAFMSDLLQLFLLAAAASSSSLFLTALDFDLLQLFSLAALLLLDCSSKHISLFLTALLAFSSSVSL